MLNQYSRAARMAEHTEERDALQNVKHGDEIKGEGRATAQIPMPKIPEKGLAKKG